MEEGFRSKPVYSGNRTLQNAGLEFCNISAMFQFNNILSESNLGLSQSTLGERFVP